MDIISASVLHRVLSGATRPVLLQVLPEEACRAETLPGSLRACVYESVFLDSVRALVPDQGTPIIVYGEGGESLDSEAAAYKLRAAGYTAVTDFRGGLSAWRAAGFSTEKGEAPAAPPELNGVWLVNTTESVIRWTGRNLFNHHEGTLPLAGGQLEFSRGELENGSFTVDMNGIACADIKDPTLNAMLIRHLRDEDFFAVARFPSADFQVRHTWKMEDVTPGQPNWEITGDLTLRGQMRHLTFPAVVALSPEGRITAQASLEIDRTDWGVNYGSGRLFAALGKHVVNDHIHLHLKIHADPA